MQVKLQSDEPFEGFLFSKHFLKDKLPKTEEWKKLKDKSEKKFYEINKIYKNKVKILHKLEESQLEEDFIKPILKILEYTVDVQAPSFSIKGVEDKPDYAFFENERDKEKAIDVVCPHCGMTVQSKPR